MLFSPNVFRLRLTRNMPVARPNNGISTEFEIGPKFVELWFKMYSTDLNDTVHT